MSTIIISVIIIAILALNIRYIIKQRRKGSCVGCSCKCDKACVSQIVGVPPSCSAGEGRCPSTPAGGCTPCTPVFKGVSLP
jgi:hypothetical protein